ncbi:Astra associated protein 1 Asa1 [Diplodia seriata]|uniref:Astra associated protein 1 Asa1 n=2 Tax=Diplodia seriata TaxID=420778 RepID=A0ABR3C6U7_9PEZI
MASAAPTQKTIAVDPSRPALPTILNLTVMSHPPQLQHAQRPPAQPAYILRGHAAHVHAVRFLRHNSRLLTGDADGWVVLWNVATKRAVAVWRAHDGAILGFGTWAEDKLVT